MFELGLVFAAMSAVAVLWVIIPVLRAKVVADVERNAINVRIFQERMAELDADLKEQRIDEVEFKQLKTELEKNLLADADAQSASASSTFLGEGKLAVVVLLALLIPFLAGTYYWLHGGGKEAVQWLQLQERMSFIVDKALTGSAPTQEEAKGVTLADFIRVIQKKLQQDQQNAIGWMLLGVSYLQIQMPKEAEEALHRAYELQPQNMEIQMAYAQAMIAANEGRLNEFSSTLLTQILANRPGHPQALMLLGMASFNAGQYQAAIDAWQHLLSINSDDSEGAQIIRRSIDAAKQRLANPAAGTAAAAGGARIRVTVTLDAALQDQIKPTDTLFVFAKAANGPPMPLAVHRQTVSGFPVTVELSDADAMSEGMTLSRHPRVVINARISRSGQAIAQPGDIQGASGVIEVASQQQPVAVVIQEQVK